MKLFFVRHQAAGVLFDHPFASEPSKEETDALLAKCVEQFGAEHPKTGKSYWSKVVCVENGVTTTVRSGCGASAEDADCKACGGCPIREAGHKRWPDAPEAAGHSHASMGEMGVSGRGTVK